MNEPLAQSSDPQATSQSKGAKMTELYKGDLGKKLKLDQAAHPGVCLATIFFKGASIVTYLFCSWILDDYVLCFIFSVVLSSIDFWVMKNISGRLLVGLRWWSKMREDGSEEWVFESKDKEYEANAVDKSFFWGAQWLAVGFWLTMFVISVLGFSIQWAVIKFVSLVLTGTNLYCFHKCSKERQAKMSDLKGYIGQQVAQQAINQALKGGV